MFHGVQLKAIWICCFRNFPYGLEFSIRKCAEKKCHHILNTAKAREHPVLDVLKQEVLLLWIRDG